MPFPRAWCNWDCPAPTCFQGEIWNDLRLFLKSLKKLHFLCAFFGTCFHSFLFKGDSSQKFCNFFLALEPEIQTHFCGDPTGPAVCNTWDSSRFPAEGAQVKTQLCCWEKGKNQTQEEKKNTMTIQNSSSPKEEIKCVTSRKHFSQMGKETQVQ